MSHRLTLPGLVVVLAVVAAAVLRLVGLSRVPGGLNQDEAVTGYDAWSIFQTGRDHLGHPVSLAGVETFGDWSSPVLTFLAVPFVGLMELSIESVRLPSALLGVVAAAVCYLLGRELTGNRAVGAIAAWTVALLPSAIHLSRWAIPPTTVPLMVALTMLSLVWALRRRDATVLVVAAIVSGLAMASYQSLRVYIPALVVAIAVIYWRSVVVLVRRAPGRFALAAGLGMAIAGPILWINSRDPGGRARAEQVSAFNDPSFGTAAFLRAYGSYFSPGYLFERGDGDGMHLPPGFGAFPLALLPLLVAGLAALVVRVAAPRRPADRATALVLLAAVALIPIPGAFTLPAPQFLRSAQLIPLGALVAAIGVVALMQWGWSVGRGGKGRLRRTGVLLLVAVGVGVAGTQLSDQYRNYFTRWPDQTASAFQAGGLEANRYAYLNRARYDTVYVTGMNQGYIYTLFAGPWDPSDVHEELSVIRNPPSFNVVTGIGNMRYSDPPDEDITRQGDIVFQATRGTDVLFTATAYQTPTGESILVVRPA